MSAKALLELGNVHLLVAPPNGQRESADTLGLEASRYASILHMNDAWRTNPGRWIHTWRPSLLRRIGRAAWVTAGMLVPLRRYEARAASKLIEQRSGQSAFDIVFCFQSHTALFVLDALGQSRHRSGKFIVDWDAAERPGVKTLSTMLGKPTLARKLKALWNDWKLARLEALLISKAALTICASEVDRAYFQGLSPKMAVAVVPNCITICEPSPNRKTARTEPKRLLFVGTLNYWPNKEGVLNFYREVWPRVRKAFPDATWDIVGLGVPPEIRELDGRDGVVVHGPVPDLTRYYDSCDIAIAPMPFSVGSAIKILEALAFRRPLVGYEISTIRHALIDGTHVAAVRTPHDFAERTIELLSDPQAAQEMADRGYNFVRETYNDERIRTHLVEVTRNAR